MSAHGKTRLLSLTWGVYVLPFSSHCLSFQGICVISLPFKLNKPYYSNIRSLGKNSENLLLFLCSSLTIILHVYCWSLIFFLEYKLVLATVFVISGNSTGLAIIWVCVRLYFSSCLIRLEPQLTRAVKVCGGCSRHLRKWGTKLKTQYFGIWREQGRSRLPWHLLLQAHQHYYRW